MRSSLQRRVAQLESAAAGALQNFSEPLNEHAFLACVENRRRVKNESFEVAVQALLVELRDDQIEILLADAEAAYQDLST
jgi:hypothetical protein